MTLFLTLALGTLVSEDLTCVTAGLLVQRGAIDPLTATVACAAGILGGDVGLWAAGRVFGRPALAWPWVARTLRAGRVDELRASLERHAALAILGSRFLPGARLPLYVVAGVVKMPGRLFALWAAVAAALWTPFLILLTARLGDAFVTRVAETARAGRAAAIVTAVVVLVVVRLSRALPRHSTIS